MSDKSSKQQPKTSITSPELCQHYSRRCFLQCPECDEFYPCRLCHGEKDGHELDRYNVKKIKCSFCQVVQKVSATCMNCETNFGKYFCSVCTMFDDNDKGQFHCVDCGLCRVGGREKFFHCSKCDMCLCIGIKDTHKCIEKSSHSNCSVCLEDMHTSRNALQVPPCGHLIHGACYKILLKHGQYRCPTCGKSTVEMSETWNALDKEIDSTPMPEEYANIKSWVLCRDCQAITETKFHVVGMKCQECNSYNTCNSAAPAQRVES